MIDPNPIIEQRAREIAPDLTLRPPLYSLNSDHLMRLIGNQKGVACISLSGLELLNNDEASLKSLIWSRVDNAVQTVLVNTVK